MVPQQANRQDAEVWTVLAEQLEQVTQQAEVDEGTGPPDPARLHEYSRSSAPGDIDTRDGSAG